MSQFSRRLIILPTDKSTEIHGMDRCKPVFEQERPSIPSLSTCGCIRSKRAVVDIADCVHIATYMSWGLRQMMQNPSRWPAVPLDARLHAAGCGMSSVAAEMLPTHIRTRVDRVTRREENEKFMQCGIRLNGHPHGNGIRNIISASK